MTDEPAKAAQPMTATDRLKAEIDMLTRGGVIEVAVRNPSVAEYMAHWEGRAEKAEAKNLALATFAREAVEAAQAIERLLTDNTRGVSPVFNAYQIARDLLANIPEGLKP